MKLIWTYDINAKQLSEVNRTILTNYYILSIKSAKNLGYYTIMYCNSSIKDFWSDYVDEVNEVDNYENSLLWDSFKIKVLEERDDEFCLIDGDVILHDRLPEFYNEVVIDGYEIMNWYSEYLPTIEKLTELNISDVIDLWECKRHYVMSCGILYIKTPEIRKTYVNLWKLFNQFVISNKDSIDTYRATGVGAQFLLTLMVKKNNLRYNSLSSHFGDRNEYYQHFFGDNKYKHPLVPTDTIITKDFQSKIF